MPNTKKKTLDKNNENSQEATNLLIIHVYFYHLILKFPGISKYDEI